jgi:nickel transport protein
VLQVGSEPSGGFDRALGYPAELVPLDNPYTLRRGATLRIRALVDGRPVANQYVVTGGRRAGDARIAQRGVRTDSDGVARVALRSAGIWYVKFIHMARASQDSTIDYESKWATLTFQVR